MNNTPAEIKLTNQLEKMMISRNKWKAKNKNRYDEIKALKMRLEETQESRNKWKNDCNLTEEALQHLQQEHDKSEVAILNLVKELDALKKRRSHSVKS